VKYRERKSAELGLLTAADYMNRKLEGAPAVVHGVQKLIGSKYSEEAIQTAVLELNQSSL